MVLSLGLLNVTKTAVKIIYIALNIPLMQGMLEEVPTVHFHYLPKEGQYLAVIIMY